MDNVFLYCAIGGGTVLVCQALLTLLGLGGHGELGDDLGHGGVGHGGIGHGDHDLAHDGTADTGHGFNDGSDIHDSNWFFGLLTFRTIIAAITFFGLTGKSAENLDVEPFPTLLIALAGGAAAMFAVHGAMRMLNKLRADGTVRIERAVGHRGVVYLSIPAEHSGAGKIHINLQNRTVECPAVTAGPRLPTGAIVFVTAVLGPDRVEVAELPHAGPTTPATAPTSAAASPITV